MTLSYPRPSRTPQSGETVVVQVCIPLALSIEIGKLRVATRTNNATVIADLLSEALAARGIKVEAEHQAPRTKGRKSHHG